MDSLRISDADREAATDLLAEQYSLGRLSKDEFDERSDAVWSARTQGDLAPVFADLPVHAPATADRRSDRQSRRPPRGRRRFPVLLAPVLFVLLALTVATHASFVLLGVLAWFLLSRRCGSMSSPWSGHAGRRNQPRH